MQTSSAELICFYEPGDPKERWSRDNYPSDFNIDYPNILSCDKMVGKLGQDVSSLSSCFATCLFAFSQLLK